MSGISMLAPVPASEPPPPAEFVAEAAPTPALPELPELPAAVAAVEPADADVPATVPDVDPAEECVAEGGPDTLWTSVTVLVTEASVLVVVTVDGEVAGCVAGELAVELDEAGAPVLTSPEPASVFGAFTAGPFVAATAAAVSPSAACAGALIRPTATMPATPAAASSARTP